jgi:hypothetical protein
VQTIKKTIISTIRATVGQQFRMNPGRFAPINRYQGRIQDFKLGGGGALKKIAPSGGRHENIWGISCEKSRFYAKNHIFFEF